MHPPPSVSGLLPKNDCKYSHYFTITPKLINFFHVFVVYLWFYQDRLHLNNAQIDLELLSTCTIFVVVDGFMVHILVVFGAL